MRRSPIQLTRRLIAPSFRPAATRLFGGVVLSDFASSARRLSTITLPPLDLSRICPSNTALWKEPSYKFDPHPLPLILRSLTPSGVDAQLDITRVAAAIAFRTDPSQEYSDKWLPDIQRGVEIWADLCGKVGRRPEDWDPLQEQATSGEPVGWTDVADYSWDGMDLVVGIDVVLVDELGRHGADDLTRLVMAKAGIDSLLKSRLPSNDGSTRLHFYAEFGPALVLDVLALRSVVDFDLSTAYGSGSGMFHYCNADPRLWWVLPPCPTWADRPRAYYGWLFDAMWKKRISEKMTEFEVQWARRLLWGGLRDRVIPTPLTLPSSILSERAVRRIAAGRVFEEQHGEPWFPSVAYPDEGVRQPELKIRRALAKEFFQQEAAKDPAKDEEFWGQFARETPAHQGPMK